MTFILFISFIRSSYYITAVMLVLQLKIDRSQSFLRFVPQEENITVKLARLTYDKM